jgi:hypothetical protein
MNAVGQPISRADGRLKMTGRARYTADIPVAGAAHAAIVHSTIANGRTVSIDTAAAEMAAGLLAVFTHRKMPRMNPTPKPWSHLHPHGQGYLPLQDDKIHHAGQPIALVVAATLDQATHAGTLIRAEYDGVNLLWPEVIGSVRGRYFILTRQELDVETAKEWGAVNEIVPADKLLARAREIAEGLAKLPPLTSSYTRIALTQKLRRIIDEGVGYGLALEGISAADVARSQAR